MAYTKNGMQQLADMVKEAEFGSNGWDYTYSMSETPDTLTTTITVYRKLGSFRGNKQTQIGSVDVDSIDLNRGDYARFTNVIYEHVSQIVYQYERSELMRETNVDSDQMYRDQASREVIAEYASTLTNLGVNTSNHNSSGMQSIIQAQARLLRAQAENSPNVGFLASELSAMKHSFADTARQEADRSYPGRLSTPLGRERSEDVERFRQHARERDQVRRDAERSNVERHERESLRQTQQREYERIRNATRPGAFKPSNKAVIKTRIKPLVEEKVRQTDLFEDTGRKFRID